MVKSVFSLLVPLNGEEIVWQQWEMHFFGASLKIGAHFLFALNSCMSMEGVIIWELNQTKIFQEL